MISIMEWLVIVSIIALWISLSLCWVFDNSMFFAAWAIFEFGIVIIALMVIGR